MPINGDISGFSSGPSIGRVKVVSSSVQVISGDRKSNVGGFGMKLQDGDVVVTDAKGKAHIILADGGVIVLTSFSRITLSQKTTRAGLKKTVKQGFAFEGKLRAQIKRRKSVRLWFKSANTLIDIKGTDFIAEYKSNRTTVATLQGLVKISSLLTGSEIDIPPGKMSSISAAGEVLPLSEITGEILSDVEIAGKKLTEKEIAGEKL